MARRPKDRKEAPPGKSEIQGVPIITPPSAMVFAKMLHVGCPPIRAIHYMFPHLDVDAAKAVARSWLNDRLTLNAVEELNGGNWQDLDKDKRLQLALDKNNAEAAFYLWTSNLADTEHKDGLDKVKLCREIVKSALGQQVDESDPMQAFARMAMELAKNMTEQKAAAASRKKAPPELQTSAFDALTSGRPS